MTPRVPSKEFVKISGLILLGLALCSPACSPDKTPLDAALDGDGDGDADADAHDAGPDGGEGGAQDDGSAGDDGGLPDGGEADGTCDGGGDPGSDLWGWCPASGEYLGGDWKWRLRVTGAALYCGTFDESRTLEDELFKKSQLRIIPGDYPLPTVDGTYPFRLPLCLKYQAGQENPQLAGAGTLQATFTTYQGDLYFNFNLRQPLLAPSGAQWEFSLHLSGMMPPGGDTIALDGSHPDDCSGTPVVYVELLTCRGDCASWLDARVFDSCAFEDIPEGVHRLTFAGGDIEVGLRIGCSPASTEPGIFSRASGTLDGTAFDQRDYWRLIYNPAHHHFSRDAAVLFDTPIGPACGLKLEGLDPFCCRPLRPECYNECQSTLSLIDCDLGAIEKRDIESEAWEK
ncbi:MAG: hypothetical protein GYA21_03950 [Myxococcales bacterium]|nr:hypothetical protein [Myxococcales bacterium]